MALVTLRWLSVLLLLLVFASRHVRGDWPTLRNRLPFLAAMGALGFTGFNALYYTAAHSTSAINIGIIQGSIPVLVLLGAFAVYRTRVSLVQCIGVGISLLGVAVVASQGQPARVIALAVNPGDMLMVAACVLYAGYTVALRRGPAVSPLGFLTVSAAAAFIASVPLVVAEWHTGALAWPSATGWLIVAAVTLFPSLLAQVLFIQGVQEIGPGRAALFVNLVPVFAAIMGVTFLGEPFERFHAAALSLVLFGIWLSERPPAS